MLCWGLLELLDAICRVDYLHSLAICRVRHPTSSSVPVSVCIFEEGIVTLRSSIFLPPIYSGFHGNIVAIIFYYEGLYWPSVPWYCNY